MKTLSIVLVSTLINTQVIHAQSLPTPTASLGHSVNVSVPNIELVKDKIRKIEDSITEEDRTTLKHWLRNDISSNKIESAILELLDKSSSEVVDFYPSLLMNKKREKFVKLNDNLYLLISALNLSGYFKYSIYESKRDELIPVPITVRRASIEETQLDQNSYYVFLNLYYPSKANKSSSNQGYISVMIDQL